MVWLFDIFLLKKYFLHPQPLFEENLEKVILIYVCFLKFNMQKEDQLPRRNLIWPFRKEKNNEKIIEENKESQPSNITRRSILAGALGTVLFVLSRKAFARNFLKISYKVHKSRLLNKKEYSLKIPVHKGLSYYGLAELYTGNQTNGLYIQNFNDNLKLFYGRNQYIYIPVRLLRPILRKVLEENNFARFIIDNEEEDKINNLWDIAVGFMNNSLSVQEKIDILLMLNDEIDPNTKIVYDEQYIIVPDSLIEKRLIDEEIPKPTPAPTIKPIPKIPPTLRKRQNPYRIDISVVNLPTPRVCLLANPSADGVGHQKKLTNFN